jgi:hypothetical protein
MRHIKSERLKKLEVELGDLEQWLKLGLVPKKDIEKHKEEIRAVQSKISEEKERLQFLKESGDTEDFVPPKRAGSTRPSFTEMPSIPDIDIGDTHGGLTESSYDMESEGDETAATREHDEDEEKGDTETDAEEKEDLENDDESYFSDKNRWKRGGIIDPDSDEW